MEYGGNDSNDYRIEFRHLYCDGDQYDNRLYQYMPSRGRRHCDTTYSDVLKDRQ